MTQAGNDLTTSLLSNSSDAVDGSTGFLKNQESSNTEIIIDTVDESKNHIAIDVDEIDYFEWKDVCVTIEGKQILHNINGRVQSGQLLGILGGSGAGKTTLLNAISGRIITKNPNKLSTLCVIDKFKQKGTQVSGHVAYKGNQYELGSSSSIKYISAYVLQNDIMCATATGQEALLFSSKLRTTVPMDEQLKNIENVSSNLKLDDCRNTMIGNDAIRGMSGGEKKRTSVGCELVTNPSLVFLDEPTSGLDSFTALKTLEILKNLTQKGNKQVIATIHQPSSDIFDMIDILILLAKGHVVYYGPSKDVLQYFAKLGFQCPKYSNIADYVVNRVQEDSDFFVSAWKKHENEYIDLNFDNYSELIPQQKQTSSFCEQSIEITKREFQILARDPRPSKIRLVQTVIFALLVGVLYWQLPYNPEGLRNRFGAIFFITINSSMTGLIATIIVFPEQRLLFERERDNNMYNTTTYLIAKSLVQIPEQAIFTLIYQLIIYWLIGMDSGFFELYIALFLTVTCMGSLGIYVGCYANTAGEGMQLMPVALLPLLLFTNFLVALDQIPEWIRWIQWIDPFKYMVDCLSIMEFKGQKHDWQCTEINNVEDCHWAYDGDAYLQQIGAGYKDTYLVKDFVNTWQDSVYFDWIMIVLLLVMFRGLTWIVLVHRNGI